MVSGLSILALLGVQGGSQPTPLPTLVFVEPLEGSDTLGAAVRYELRERLGASSLYRLAIKRTTRRWRCVSNRVPLRAAPNTAPRSRSHSSATTAITVTSPLTFSKSATARSVMSCEGRWPTSIDSLKHRDQQRHQRRRISSSSSSTRRFVLRTCRSILTRIRRIGTSQTSQRSSFGRKRTSRPFERGCRHLNGGLSDAVSTTAGTTSDPFLKGVAVRRD